MGLSANALSKAMEVLPVGYQFRPTEDELLLHYLWRKNARDGEEGITCIIPEFDVYSCEPEELPARFSELSIIQAKDQKWWFFCEQDINGKTRRSTKGGSWKITGKTKDIKNLSSKEIIGSKKILTFQRRCSSTYTPTDWVMHEYLPPSNVSNGLARDSRKKNYVLCMIKCNIDYSGLSDIEPDNGSIPEESIELKMREYELELNLEQSPESLCSSANSSHMPRSSVTVCSTDTHSPFSYANLCSWVFGDGDQHYNGTGIETSKGGGDFTYMLQGGSSQEGEDHMMMYNKRTSEVESRHGCIPIDENKGVVEDDWDEATAASICVTTRKQSTAQKQSPAEIKEDNPSEDDSGESSGSSSLSVSAPPDEIKKDTSRAVVPYVPASIEYKIKQETVSGDIMGAPRQETGTDTSNAVIPNVLSTEAEARKHTPTKIKEEMTAASSSSSSTAIPKPKRAAGHSKGHANPTNSIKPEGISFVTANNNVARRNQSNDAGRTVHLTSSHHCRKCCHNEQSLDADLALKLLVVLCLTWVVLCLIDSLR